MTKLTEAVLIYKETGEGWDCLRTDIELFAYKYPFRYSNWSEDKCSDFFLAFHPRIPGLVRRYEPRFTFETYLACSLRWFMKSYTERLCRTEHYAEWSEEESLRHIEMLSETESSLSGTYDEGRTAGHLLSDDCPLPLDDCGRVEDRTLRKRVLFAVLVHAADIDSNRLPAIARLADVDPEWLIEAANRVQEIIKEKVERRTRLRYRRNEYWFQFEGARKRLQRDGLYDENLRITWERKTETWKKRYMSACEGLRRFRVSPRHRDVADILGLPQGTVSSGLHFIREQSHEIVRAPQTRNSHHSTGRKPMPSGRERRRPVESQHGNHSRDE